MRLMFKRGDFFDEDGNKLTKGAESPAGHLIEVAVLKTKVCKWDRKLGYMTLNYVRGVDIMQDTIEVATYLGLIDNSAQGIYRLMNPDTGEILIDDEGKELKIRGKKNLRPWFENHPEVFKSLYEKVYSRIKDKEDPYIKSLEEILNINVKEKFEIDFIEE